MSSSSANNDGGWLGPVVEIWVDDDPEGQTVTVTGERPDGQGFFGSFFQPTLNNSSSDSDSDSNEVQW